MASAAAASGISSHATLAHRMHLVARGTIHLRPALPVLRGVMHAASSVAMTLPNGQVERRRVAAAAASPQQAMVAATAAISCATTAAGNIHVEAASILFGGAYTLLLFSLVSSCIALNTFLHDVHHRLLVDQMPTLPQEQWPQTRSVESKETDNQSGPCLQAGMLLPANTTSLMLRPLTWFPL